MTRKRVLMDNHQLRNFREWLKTDPKIPMEYSYTKYYLEKIVGGNK